MYHRGGMIGEKNGSGGEMLQNVIPKGPTDGIEMMKIDMGGAAAVLGAAKAIAHSDAQYLQQLYQANIP